jgi:hypothetical protein
MTELGRFGVTLASNELALKAPVTARHRNLLASYRMNAHRGEKDASERILQDLRQFVDLGALDRATDLLIVLALYMREAGRHERRLDLATSRQRDAICLQRWRGLSRNGHVPARGPRVALEDIGFRGLDAAAAEPAPLAVSEGDDSERPF